MSTNGWGKGSVNNTNGWGAGAINNDIGWGDSQLRSWSGDTDLDGGTGIPVNTVAPVISGTTTLGSVLTTTNGTWTAKPTATFTYQWKRNGSNIIGATNSTYTLVNDDGATNITCEVTATNDFGSASATSNTLAIPAFTDADAQAFITAASITDPTQQSAINQLVTDLKGYGIWTKLRACYPFIGGTASQHKWNLKDPQDTNAAFRLVFSGGITHSINGVQFGGVNGWAETYLNPNTAFNTNNSFHLSIYSRTNSASNTAYEMGGQNGSTRTDLLLRSTLNNVFNRVHGNGIVTPNSNSTGMYISTRESSTSLKLFRNNVQLGSTFTGANGLRFDLTMPIGAYKLNSVNASNFSNRQYAFASVGDGLTDTETANFYTAVQAFNTALNRQV